MSPKGHDWIAIKRDYVEGIVDEEGNRIFPATLDIAQKYGLNYGTFRNRITRQKWLQERELFTAKIDEARREKRIDVLASKAAEFDSTCLKVAEAGISHIGQHLKAAAEAKKPLSLSASVQLSQALKNYQHIGRLALGESTEKQDGPPGALLGNKIEVVFVTPPPSAPQLPSPHGQD